MNRYETVFIMTPVLSAEQVAETVEKYKAFLKEHKGTIVHEEAWGLRKLFEADASAVLPFETEFRRDERVIRFLTTRMDKYHVAYAESRRNKSKEAPAPAPETTEEA